MTESAEAREWHRIIRVSVREACEAWRLETEAFLEVIQVVSER